jgi:hypothetical protein
MVADGEVEVLTFTAARFIALLAADDQLALRIYRHVSKRMAIGLLRAGGMVSRMGEVTG